jgi:hypothetical protein
MLFVEIVGRSRGTCDIDPNENQVDAGDNSKEHGAVL